MWKILCWIFSLRCCFQGSSELQCVSILLFSVWLPVLNWTWVLWFVLHGLFYLWRKRDGAVNYGNISVKTEIQNAFIFRVGSAVNVLILYLINKPTNISIVLCFLTPPAACCYAFQPLLIPMIFLLRFFLPTMHASGHFSIFFGRSSSSLSVYNYEWSFCQLVVQILRVLYLKNYMNFDL